MSFKEVRSIILCRNSQKVNPETGVHQRHRKEIITWKIARTLQYVVIFFILGSFFLLQASRCVMKYRDKPTYMENIVSNQMDTEFPSFTICPMHSGYKSSVLAKHGISPASSYYGTRNHTWQSVDKTVTPEQLFDLATHSLQDLVKKFRVRTIIGGEVGLKNSTTFYASLDHDDDIYNFVEQRHRSFGKCYTAEPGPKTRTLGVYYLKIHLHESVKVYFHHCNQFLDLSGRMGIKVQKHQKIQLQSNYAAYQMLEEETKMGFKCRIVPHYDDCMYRGVTAMMMEGVGCTVPWVKNSSICNREDHRNFSFWEHYTSITNQEKTCPNPCHFLRVHIGAKNREKLTNDTLLYIYFQNRALTHRENFLYTTLSLAAEIGGYLGLLLGMSLFTFADLVSTLINRRIKTLQKKERNEVEKILSAEEFITKRIEELREEIKQRIVN